MPRKRHKNTSADIDVTYDKARCLHVAECLLGLRAVFDNSKTPWVQPDKAPANQVAAVIHRCPTGALQYERKDGGPAETPDAQNTVRVAAAGPLYVRGRIELTVVGEKLSETRVALCRCGKSANKPYCDNTHLNTGFEDDGHGVQKTVAESLPEGPLTIIPRPNASYLFEGPVEIQSSDGRILYRGEKVSLCRCGGSQTKPFCDGSHKTNGFEAA